MAHEFQRSRTQIGGPERLDPRWLSTLIDAMEQAARPEIRDAGCDPMQIAAVTAHLARPVTAFAIYGSAYSLRN